MSYVFQNIFMCLLIAGLIGGVAGWILHRLLSGSRTSDIETAWQARLDGERAKLTASVGEQEGLVAQWKTKFSGLDGDFGKLKTDFAGIQARIPGLETSLGDWTAKAKAFEASEVKLAAELKACGAARTVLEGQLAGWTEKAKAWDGERAKMVSQGGSVSNKIPVLETAIAGWVAKSALWDGDRTSLDTSLTSANAEIAALKSRIGQLELVADAAKHAAKDDSRIIELQAELKRVGDLAKADNNTYEEQIADFKLRLTAMQDESATAQGKLSEVTASLAAKASSDELSGGEVDALRAQIDVLREQLQTASSEAKRLGDLAKADNNTYEEQIADFKLRLTAMQDESATAQGKLSEVTASLAAKASSDELSGGEVDALRAQIDVLREQLQTASSEAKRLGDLAKADNNTYEEQIADFKLRLTAMQDESATAQGKLSEVTASLAAKVSSDELSGGEVDALRAQIDVLREQLQTASSEAKRLGDLATADNNTYEEQIADFKLRLTAMQDESATAQGKLSEVTASLAAKASSDELSGGEVEALKAQIDVLREQLQTASAEAKRVGGLAKADNNTYEEAALHVAPQPKCRRERRW